jgi:hypothetical protein
MTERAQAGLYYRQGSRVTPGIMTLDSGVLSYATEQGEVFRAPIGEVDATFSRYSTLTIVTRGTKYDFVTGAYAGALAPHFSEKQLAELSDDAGGEALRLFGSGAVTVVTANVVGGLAVLAGSVLGRVASIAGNAVGVVNLFRSQSQSFALAKAWAQYLAANGVAVRMRGTTFGRSQWMIAAIVIPGLVLVGVLATVLQLALR